MSIADRIAEITQRLGDIQGQGIRDQGNIQAQAIANSGQIWSQAISNLGQLPGQVVGQMQQYKNQQQEQQIRQVQIARLQQIQAGEKNANALLGALKKNPDGTYDVADLLPKLGQANVPLEQQEPLLKSIDSMNTVIASFTKQRTDHGARVADAALQAAKKSGEPFSVPAALLWLNGAAAANIATPDEVNHVKQALLQGADPTRVFEAIRSQGSQFAAKPITNETEAALAAAGGDPVASRAMGYLKPPPQPTETTLGLAAAGGDPAKALELIKGGTVNAAKDDQRYEQIQQAGILKQPVSPEDRAWAQAYEKRKTIGPEATAAAAADRQAATIAQQTAQQARAQGFAESQAGRKELTEKVEQPYQDAVEKASTLRSVVDAAKNGNMEAANVQSLLGTLGLVTMEGVKRINTTELNQVAGAGSLLERIKSQVGGLVAGKPLSPRLQQDLVQLSGLLEQSARQKYESGFKQVTTRYGLKDEQVMPAGGGTAAAGPQEGETKPIPGYPGTEQTFKGGKWIRTK